MKIVKAFQPPSKLGEGFLNFAKEIHQKSVDKGIKFTEEEIAEFFNKSLSGKIRANFIFWIADLNRIVDSMNIILSDLSDLRKDKFTLKGDPVIRSEFLFQAFFGEFFGMREISKIFIKLLTSLGIIDKKQKVLLNDSFFKGFDWVYDIRNMLIHQGVSFKNYDVNFGLDFLNDLSFQEIEKFTSLIQEANTRENTVEIQCAFYMEIMIGIMDSYSKFQNRLGDLLAELVLLYERHIEITVTKNEELKNDWTNLKELYLKNHSSKNLKSPQIRVNALEKIENYLKDISSEILNDPKAQLKLIDKNDLISSLEKHKGNVLNGAEKSVVTSLYKFSILL